MQTVQRKETETDKFTKECLNDNNFEDKLKPSDIKLSTAMAMSAAAISPYLGKNEEIERRFTHFLSVFGIETAADMVYDMAGERNENCLVKVGLR